MVETAKRSHRSQIFKARSLTILMENSFCRRCGSTLKDKSAFFECKNGHHIFPAPSPAAGIFFIRDEKVILSRRAIEPHKGTLDTIGGFVDLNENFEQAIEREIIEETGVERAQYGPLTYLCSAIRPYEYQSETKQVISVFFTAKLDADAIIKVQDDINGVEELEINDILPEQIGNEDVKIAFKVLRKDMENT